MKREYVKPILSCESFKNDEYVTACWWVNCNISTGNVYYENGKEAGLQTWGYNVDTLIGYGVSGCKTKHVGVTEEPTSNSYWVSYGGGSRECFSWQDRHGWHSSYIEDAQWESNPNAS